MVLGEESTRPDWGYCELEPFPFGRSKKIRCQKLDRRHFGELNSELELACWSWGGGSGKGLSEPGGGGVKLCW